MGADSVSETSDNLHTLTRPSAHHNILLHSLPAISSSLFILWNLSKCCYVRCVKMRRFATQTRHLLHILCGLVSMCAGSALHPPLSCPGATRRVVWGRAKFSGCPYLTFTTASRAAFVKVILSVFKWIELIVCLSNTVSFFDQKHAFLCKCEWNRIN